MAFGTACHTRDANKWETDCSLLTPASSNRLHGGEFATSSTHAQRQMTIWAWQGHKNDDSPSARLSLLAGCDAWIFNRERAGWDARTTFLIHTNMPEVRHTLNPKFGLAASLRLSEFARWEVRVEETLASWHLKAKIPYVAEFAEQHNFGCN